MDTTATADDPPTTTTTAAAAAPTTLTREQQREARRQKVLARSNLSGSASPVVDLASQSQVGVGMSAAIDDDPAVPSLVDDGVDTTATAKSGARLAAERRRQRILSKSNERMAKVQGDRVGHGGGSAADGDTGADDGDGAGAGGLDEMLDAAEAEFFGEHEGKEGTAFPAAAAESKPAASSQRQPYFKSSPLASPAMEASAQACAAVAVAGAAQSKPASERAAVGVFKPTRSEAAPRKGSAGASNRRRSGNKALDTQAFDMDAVQSLSRSAQVGIGQAGQIPSKPGGRRLLGGVRFWTGLEAVTKAALLLLVGAAIGGLLMPEARAAVAQAEFAAAQRVDEGDAHWRSNLESFLTAGAGRKGPGGVHSMDDLAGANAEIDDEFGTDSSTESVTLEAKATGSEEVEDELDVLLETTKGSSAAVEDVGESERAGEWEEAMGYYAFVVDGFMQFMESILDWAHGLSSAVMPLGLGGRIPCVPALFLALLVRLVVSTVFLCMRMLLGLPVFLPAVGDKKPGMMMGMLLAAVPVLGKVLAVGMAIKSVLSDTTLIVTGTVVAMALRLGVEEDSPPRRLAGSMLSLLGGPLLDWDGSGDKEL